MPKKEQDFSRENDSTVGAKIRALRRIRGLSLQQMSQETGMSYSYLSGLENGKHSVSITNLQRIAKYFGVDMVYFLMPSGAVPKVFRKEELFMSTCPPMNPASGISTSTARGRRC